MKNLKGGEAKDLRESYNISRTELARYLGYCGRQAIARYEDDSKKEVSKIVSLFFNYAEVFGVDEAKRCFFVGWNKEVEDGETEYSGGSSEDE